MNDDYLIATLKFSLIHLAQRAALIVYVVLPSTLPLLVR